MTPGQAGPYSGVFPAGLVNPDKNNFSPRVGIAWRPFPKHSTLIRAGYGIFFNGSVYNQFPQRAGSPAAIRRYRSLVTSTSKSADDAERIRHRARYEHHQHIRGGPGLQSGLRADLELPIQQTLPHYLTLETAYLGTKGTRLDIQISPNTAAPGSPLTDAAAASISANAGLFTFDTPNGNSIYHALVTRFNRRFAKGHFGQH